MVIWGIFWGTVLGSIWPNSGDEGWFLGALLGLVGGFSLRWTVRRELKSALAKQQPQATPQPQPASAPPARAIPLPIPDQLLPQGTLLPAAVSAADNEAQRAPPQPPPNRPLSESAATPATAQPATVQPPRQLNPAELAVLAARDWLLGGNTIVRVGLVVLFIGLSFLARYAAFSGFFPVELRLAAIGAAAIALLAVGFRKRMAKPGFALALQGAGVAVMYLTVFAAFRLYGLLPPLLAFALMLAVCATGCALALLQNSRALAVAAFAGGFAVPLLLSSGQGSHIALFGYYLLLNLAILFIAYRRAWRVLHVVGFIATFGVATAWGLLKYAPEQYASSQLFLAAFVLIYLFTAILYARNMPTRLGNAVDSMLVFGTPLAGFGLQAGLVRGMELGTAFSAVGFAALYLATAMVLARRALGSYRLLVECFMAVGVGFATLAVPLALDVRWTSAVWALEGAGAFWVGMRQARWMPRAFGLLLQAVAAVAFLDTIDSNISAIPLANPSFVGALLIALPAFALAWWLRRPLAHSDSRWARGYARLEMRLASPAYLYAFAFWCLALMLEITRRLPSTEIDLPPAPVLGDSAAQLLIMLALVASAALSMRLGLQTRWPVAAWPARLSLLVMALGWAAQAGSDHRVLHTPGWLVWPAVLVLHYWMLRQSDRLAAEAGPPAAEAGTPAPARRLPFRYQHAGTAWLVTLLLADCLWSGIGQADLWRTSWAGVVLLVSAVAVLMALVTVAGRAHQQARRATFGWPLNPQAEAYYWNAALPLGMLVFLGALFAALFSSGRTAPLPYIPLLNPTELTLAMALGALIFWRRLLATASPAPGKSGWVTGTRAAVSLALLAFVMLNTMWLRIAHHFFGVRWDAGELFASFVVQTGYAILWTLLALSLMVLAHRRVQRLLWSVGAGLLGLVIVKLLLIDLSNAGGGERIVAFIVVGVLMLVVGYFAPLPPKPAITSMPATDDLTGAQASMPMPPPNAPPAGVAP